ncbi:vicilin-like seed storage protein At2g18540 isoform X2 [Eurytemora carolleeae]|uniref:vicilin-like seed storage protein At2g18540 isoform X2 n=1 Tax=Eurytemora carolleeae TaxID=1294199 RepID=UPI000C77B5EB|nr:vicilin-like seed storage protein At2g18540 isoform X2 [Eurytemora carolleeae]|eukprot:XP_023340171.1 vicilin-like seed storage protein At2g18540 isoform X2 [Eurytemora affinis]
MVRVYSQPGQFGSSSLGGLFGDPKGDNRRIDYEDYLEDRRREDLRRNGEYGGLRSSSSEGYLDKAWIQNQGGPGEDGLNSTTLQQQIDQLSQALSRIQGYSGSNSYPSSAQAQDPARKTWSAPNKDPFGPLPDLTNLADPMGRRSQAQNSGSSGYVPSFGSGQPLRGRRGGGNAAPPVLDRASYIQELRQQMEEQDRRKAEEKNGKDWWEKSEPKYETTPQQKITGRAAVVQRSGDQGDARKQYEQELREQMEHKKMLEDKQREKEREEEQRIERRTQEQQERMRKEFEEEMKIKKSKEDAKLKRQEELMKRQEELQKELTSKKRSESELRLTEKRGGKSPRYSAITERRGNSPPIPTMREKNGVPEQTKDEEKEEGEEEVVERLTSMRRVLEQRRDQLLEQEAQGKGVWEGLEE